jgi:hypothetical protein
VEYHLDPGDRATTHLDVAEIASEKLDVVRHAREICFVAGAEIVYHPDGVSESNEPLDEMRADEAGSPRY